MDVAGASGSDVGALPELLHDLGAAEDAFGLLGEQEEQLELGKGELDRVSVHSDLMTGEVDLDPAPRELRCLSAGAEVELAPAEQGAHPTHEFRGGEGFRQLVVCPELEPENAVDLGVSCRQHGTRPGSPRP